MRRNQWERLNYVCNVCHRPGGWWHRLLIIIGVCRIKRG
jgi:hypothetical protein